MAELNWREKQIFLTTTPGLFVFNFGKYLFLFHDIMKTWIILVKWIQPVDEKKTLLSWLLYRMLEKWKSIFRVKAAGAWAVALPTRWESFCVGGWRTGWFSHFRSVKAKVGFVRFRKCISLKCCKIESGNHPNAHQLVKVVYPYNDISSQ